MSLKEKFLLSLLFMEHFLYLHVLSERARSTLLSLWHHCFTSKLHGMEFRRQREKGKDGIRLLSEGIYLQLFHRHSKTASWIRDGMNKKR